MKKNSHAIRIILLLIMITVITHCKTGTTTEGVSDGIQFVTKKLWEQRIRSVTEPEVTPEERQQIAQLITTHTEGTGDISVDSIPPSANVIINGRKMGKTPVVLHGVQPGRHIIKVMLDTFKSASRIIELKDGKTVKVKFQLQKYLSDLHIHSDMPGADVFLDGRKVGKTPVKLQDITMGKHTVWLQLEKDGVRYYGFEEIWLNEENKAWKIGMRKYVIPPHFVKIPAGKFKMGITPQFPDEGPPRDVYTEEFYISKYEVTNEEFLKVFHSHTPSPYSKGSRNPVTNVTWFEAYLYAKAMGYRLPTEAEWDKAARGGKNLRLAITGGFGAFSPRRTIWMGLETLEEGSAPVGKHRSNPYGVHDMSGNANEWVNDWYDENYFQWSTNINPPGPEFGTLKVMRGSSWHDKGFLANLSTRYKYLPDERKHFGGFRCALNAWIE